MINGKFNVILVLILVLAVLTPNLVYAGNLTGSWSGSVGDGGRSAVVTSQAGNVTVKGVVSTVGNARWGVSSDAPGSTSFSNGKLNTNNFWSNPSARGHTSLQSTYWWDIHADNPSSIDIDRPGDDKGTGYITFYFSKPVVNPVLDLDRMGGEGRISKSTVMTNSAKFTLLDSGLTLTKLTGNSQFSVTSNTIQRIAHQKLSQFNQESSWTANSAGAGSVMIKGITDHVSFKWTGTGIEGVGCDGIELVWDLTEYVDNTAPVVTSSLSRNMVRSGDNLTVDAQSSSDTSYIVANVMGNLYSMNKGSGNNWNLNFTVPDAADGLYTVLLSAFDDAGNMGTSIMNFTVDNTAPVLVGDLNQTTSRTGDKLMLNVSADNDTDTLTATILGEVYNLTKGTDGSWTLQYLVPQVTDGIYTIFLTGVDVLGNMGNTSLNFTVDNTAPGINGSVLPGLTKTGNSVLVKAVSDPDTVRMTATILGTTYNMIQSPDSIWTLQYTVPQVMDGFLQVFLDAWDGAGNHGFDTTNMSVDNALPGVNCTVLPGRAKNGGNVTLRVCADSDVVNVTALIAGNHYNLTQNSDDTWTLKYPIQGLADGFQTILLTATNGLGSQGTAYTSFTVDNTAPALKVEVLPVTVREGGKLFVRVYSDVDALVVTAEILGKTYNLIKGSNSIWTLTYTVPELKDGNYNVLLRGWDDLNNTNNTTVVFKVQNPVTPINHGSSGGASGSSTSNLHSVSQGYSNGVQGGSSGSAVAGKVVSPVVGGGLSAVKPVSGSVFDYYFKEFYVNTGVLTDPGKLYSFISKSLMPGGFLMGSFNEYTNLKISEALNKARSTGNFWDFWNYDFFHFYGYSNVKEMWGGENIQWLLETLFGIDSNGNMSVGNFLINILALLPIGRLGSLAWKGLTAAFGKSGIRIGLNLTDNAIINGLKDIISNLIHRFNLKNPEIWRDIISVVGDVVLPNPFTIVLGFLGYIAKRNSGNMLSKAVLVFGNFEFKRGSMDLGAVLLGPNPTKKIVESWHKSKNFVVNSAKYIFKVVKSSPIVKNTVKIVKKTWKKSKPYVKLAARGFVKAVQKSYKYVKSKPQVKWVKKQPFMKRIINSKPVKTAINVGKVIWNGFKKWAFK